MPTKASKKISARVRKHDRGPLEVEPLLSGGLECVRPERIPLHHICKGLEFLVWLRDQRELIAEPFSMPPTQNEELSRKGRSGFHTPKSDFKLVSLTRGFSEGEVAR